MKFVMRFLSIAVLTITTALVVAGQENNDPCPKIEIIGPAGVTDLGNKMTFVARLSRTDSAFRFEWRVSPAGRLAEGQGTQAVTVIATEPNANVIAPLTVGGFPDGCDNVAKAVASIAQIPPLESLDRWEKKSRNDERGRLDVFFTDISNNPGFKGVIVFYGVPASKQNAKNSRLIFFVGHAKFRKFDPALLHFVFDGRLASPQSVTVYRMRDPADYPCSDCIRVRGDDVKQ